MKKKFFFIKKSLPHTIRFQLVLYFLAISLIPLMIASYVTYNISKRVILTGAKKHLQNSGLKQISLLNVFFSEKEKNAANLMEELIKPVNEFKLIETIEKFGVDSPEYLAAKQMIAAKLVKHQSVLNYENLILIAKNSTVLLSANQNLLRAGTKLIATESESADIFLKLFHSALVSASPQISPLGFYSKDGPPSIFIATPLLDNKLNVTAVLMFQLDDRSLFELIKNFQGVGATGETIVAFELNHELIILSSFLKNDSPQIYRINPSSSFGKFMLQVLAGQQETASIKDFRGEESIAVGKKVNPNSNWAIITKVKQSELLKTVDVIRYFSWKILALTFIAVTLLALIVAKKIASPIKFLTEKTKQMAAGDFKQRTCALPNNEIGKLGESFDEMAVQLNNMVNNLDSLVKERTSQLEHKVEELKQTQNRLVIQEKLASLGALTAGIAHEIKNPLNFVNNFAELAFGVKDELAELIDSLEGKSPQDILEQLKELLDTLNLNLSKIQKHGKRADSIVHNMLQHSRGNPSDKIETDLNKLLEEYIELAYHGYRAIDASFNVSLKKDLQADLPLLKVSPQEISRVFLSILNNAFYAVKQKQKKNQSFNPTVWISSSQDSKNINISFADNGIGIPAEVLPKLFTPFFTTKPAGEGTGLGLSLSYNIIEEHGGTIEVESLENEQTTFTIILPLNG